MTTTIPSTALNRPSVTTLFQARRAIGQVDRSRWQRATALRDPVNHLRSTVPHANRATFKLHEIASRILRSQDGYAPSRVALLAEAPGGFLFCAQRLWPRSELFATSLESERAIPFADPVSDAVVRGIPHDADLLDARVERALQDRIGPSSCDLITADGGVDMTKDLDGAEQHSTPLMLAQLSTALRLQSVGGDLILKIFEGSTMMVRQAFELLCTLYDRVLLYKPLASRVCNSERYVVARGLRSAISAVLVSERLRSALADDTASADDSMAGSDRGYCVSLLGDDGVPIPVSERTHEAFDAMARVQADAIATVLRAIDGDRTHTLRRAAQREAAQLRDACV